MQKTYNALTGLSLAGLTAAVFLLQQHHTTSAGIICMIAFLLIHFEVKNVSGWFNLTSAFIVYAVYALVLWGYNPLLSAAVLCFLPIGVIRLVFVRNFTHVRFLWVDGLCMIAGTGLYIAANIIHPVGWEGWVFPLSPVLFKNFLGSAMIVDGRNIAKRIKEEFKLQIGEPAPDFTLPDADGRMVTLSHFIGKRIVLLLFVRGDWCPFCHMMLRTYQSNSKRFQEKNVQLVAVGPDTTEVNKEMAEKLGLDFVVLSDTQFRAVNMYGLRMQGAFNSNVYNEDRAIPLPASFLICQNGIIRYMQRADDVGTGIRFDQVFDVLEQLRK